MGLTIEQYLKQNEERQRKFTDPYNPITGEGSLTERFQFQANENSTELYIPKTLEEKYGKFESIDHYAIDNQISQGKAVTELHEDRLRHDFEYWAYVYAKIKPKSESDKIDKQDPLIPFLLRYPQMTLLQKLEEMRTAGLPIRVIIVKARQWGGSTLVQIYMAWIQLIHKLNWNSVIVGAVENQARGVRSMYSTLLRHYAYEAHKFTNFEGSDKNKQLIKRGCVISIGSAEKPETLRQQDIAMAHFTEVGSWKKTEGKRPEDLVQTISGSVLAEPNTLMVFESTAKGSGNFFHREWIKAKSKESNYQPVFVPWFDISIYQQEFESESEKVEFIKSMKDYDLDLWNYGATLEGIKWYRWKLADIGDTWSMNSEFPSTPEEAFSSTGNRIFPPSFIKKMEATIRPPDFIGDVFPEVRGPECLDDIRLEETHGGNLHIWKHPDKAPEPKSGEKILHRYVTTVDIGGRSKGADFSTINILDRYYMLMGGCPERALTWRGHIDHDILAWKAVQLSQLYGDALLIIEANYYDSKRNDTEGNKFELIMNEIKEVYDNLYSRTPLDKIKENVPAKYGWWTTHQNKETSLGSFYAALRDDQYMEYDENCVFEADSFERKEDGSCGAVEGQHDDVIKSTMDNYWVCTDSLSGLPPVKIIQVDERRKEHQPRPFADIP